MKKLLQIPNPGNGGRLGNQLFGIAACIGIALKHGYTPVIPHNWKYRKAFPSIPDEWFGQMQPPNQDIHERRFEYDDYTPTGDVVSIHGYFQSYKYFEGVDIRAYLTPVGAKLGSNGSTAIHYRRGDYVGNPNYAVIPISYYMGFAENGIRAYSDDSRFITALHGTKTEDELTDFVNMIGHVVHVISNSTFAWWAAYLSGGFVVYPDKWFAGKLLKNSTRDLFPPNWTMGCTSWNANLNDCTFIIPVMYDHPDRENNLRMVTRFLADNFNTNIIVGEINTQRMDANVRFDYKGRFHRTNALNEMTKMANTPYVINWDADILANPWQILKMVQALRAGADVCYPYDGTWINIGKIGRRDVMTMLCENRRASATSSVGGAVGYNKEAFLKAGGENENFVSYGPEDQERFWRFNLLGLKVERIAGPIHHLDHFRGPDSRRNGNADSMAGHKYWEWLKKLNVDELKAHLHL